MEIPTEVSDSEINQQSSKISFDCILSSKDIKQTLAETDKMINKFSHVKINKKKDELIDFEDFIAWKEVRPFSSLDFSDGFICYPPMPLSEIPERTVEQYLIKDVLACLVGCNGDYIHVLEQLNKNEDRIFDLSRIPQSLRGLLMEGILPLAVYYSNVVRFIETNQRYAGGRVNQALAAILKELMRDYLCFVSKLEDRQRSGLSTLHELASLVHIQLRSMEFLSNLVKTITATGARGGNTLSILYLECEKSFMDEKLLILLLSKAVLPYFQSLESWIHSGYLFDPYNEFMIVDNKPKHHEKIDEQILSNWLDRYSIKKQRVPKFLESFEEKILRSGKYLNIVKRCQSLIAKEILPVKASLNKQLKFSDPRDSSYLEIINDAYNYSSSALLHLLFRHYHIIDRFRCLKRYFLMEQGDFIVILMDLCEDELNKEMSDVVPTRVLALIEFSLRLCSKGKLDRYKDDITVTFVPYDITYEMCKINAIGTSREKIYQTARHENISGFDSMTLTLNAEWPLSLVFSTKIISVYQILFRLLLKCKRVERELCRVWLGDKRFKSLERVNAAHYTNAFGLRHKMLVFVQSIQYCLMEEIIEYYFVRFMENLKKVKNVDDVLTLHWNFLKSCVDDAIFKYPILTSCIMRTLKTCSEFCDFLQDKKTERCQQSSSPSFEFKLKEIEEKFNNHVVYLLKIMVNSGKTESSDIRIARCFHKQNYNDYYTRLFHEIETSLEYSSRIRSSYAEEN